VDIRALATCVGGRLILGCLTDLGKRKGETCDSRRNTSLEKRGGGRGEETINGHGEKYVSPGHEHEERSFDFNNKGEEKRRRGGKERRSP